MFQPHPFALFLFCWFSFISALWAQDDMYALDHIVEVEIQFEDEHWRRKLTTFKENGRDKRLSASLRVDGREYPGVGVRFKGNSSLFAVLEKGGLKLPFNVKIDYADSSQTLPGGYTRLKLSNVFRDPSYLREALSYEIAQQYMAAPRANFARVHVNGEYLGLYNLTQSVDEDMLDRFFGDRSGILFKCDPDWDKDVATGCPALKRATLQYLGDDTACYLDKYELKTDDKSGWHELVKFTKHLQDSPETIDQILDVDEVLWMLAYNNVLVNLDSYTGLLCHNYYFYQDSSRIWHPVIWDMNMSLGGFRHSGQGGQLNNDQLSNLSLFLHLRDRNKERPLIVNLLSQPLYRKMYIAHAQTIYDDWLAEGQYRDLAQTIRTTIAEQIGAEPHALYTPELFDRNYETSVHLQVEDREIVGIQELMDGRARYLSEHPLMNTIVPEIGEPTVSSRENEVSISALVESKEEVEAVYLFYRSGPFQPWHHEPMAAEGSTYTISLPRDQVDDYYLVAEGKLSASILPRRSGRETFSVVTN